MTYYIHAQKFFLRNTTENGGYLEVTDNGTFGAYIPEDQTPVGKIVDYSDRWIAPGLVDTHIHGIAGADVMDTSWDSINTMSEALLKCGVTSWLPTTITGSFDQLNDICQIFGNHWGEEKGAKVQGINFEGPYFTEKHKGAQNPKYFKDPSLQEFDQWQKSAKGHLRQITVAPERKGAVEFVSKVSETGVTVAIGHSDATFEQAKACVEAGATVFTHTFNGMSPLSHREPGMVGAAMSLDQVYDELICDGHHINPYVARILIDKKTPDHVILVTDCMSAGLMPDGDYMLGELPVLVGGGTATLKEPPHNLAGSILRLNEAIKNVVDWNLVTPEKSVMMGSWVPAVGAQITDHCGAILPGRAADFIVLDQKMNLLETYLDGVSRYKV
ncbi:N-acetylglucosamine-6-phosphate deacetylase [Xylocopilactobacillus apicola]|uniref:N-acetylglucosamine-6-phosphate deacetylase n=1 Tax=Xylocopilactobacillus apicola TaxID=2932184 RepID=A0AAU9DTV5_9LACO|nr:N-acetylglucosamine-6-phosphate deacetylase [Xylocopilactobacillus apicola]BDR58868.1 N-acetylglucosamine-6-phosphate deacetylase [Xylocopilactobacillus apicola]